MNNDKLSEKYISAATTGKNTERTDEKTMIGILHQQNTMMVQQIAAMKIDMEFLQKKRKANNPLKPPPKFNQRNNGNEIE